MKKQKPVRVIFTKAPDAAQVVLENYLKAARRDFRQREKNAAAAFFLLFGSALGACFGPVWCILGAFVGAALALTAPEHNLPRGGRGLQKRKG